MKEKDEPRLTVDDLTLEELRRLRNCEQLPNEGYLRIGRLEEAQRVALLHERVMAMRGRRANEPDE